MRMMMEDSPETEMRSLALTPTWSVATVLTILVAVSLLVERSIHRFSYWLRKTRRNPLFETLEKMKEELMLLGFISLLLTATSRLISDICINSKFYSSRFSPCSQAEAEDYKKEFGTKNGSKPSMNFIIHNSVAEREKEVDNNVCGQGYEPFVSYEGLEQLHRFIFVMAITHVSYSCLMMVLAIIKIHTWTKWEDEARRDRFGSIIAEVSRALTLRRQSVFIKSQTSSSWRRNRWLVWVICFFRQFGTSVLRADYLLLRTGFIMNHNLLPTYDFHSYLIRSMEEEFKMIVGVSAPLWGFVIAFMLLNIKGSNLYFWISIIPISLVLLVGTKLQRIIVTLALESIDGADGYSNESTLKPRDDLFWFKKPELLLSLIHFVLFQNSFELAFFLWYWWQFGYDSCFIINRWLVYARLTLGFAGQFLCSYSTLPLYALVTQMGSHYKAALIPRRIRDTIHRWRKDARKNRKHRRHGDDTTTIRTETSTVCSLDDDDRTTDNDDDDRTIYNDDDDRTMDNDDSAITEIIVEPICTDATTTDFTNTSTEYKSPVHDNYISGCTAPLVHSVSVPSSQWAREEESNAMCRSFSMPIWRG